MTDDTENDEAREREIRALEESAKPGVPTRPLTRDGLKALGRKIAAAACEVVLAEARDGRAPPQSLVILVEDEALACGDMRLSAGTGDRTVVTVRDAAPRPLEEQVRAVLESLQPTLRARLREWAPDSDALAALARCIGLDPFTIDRPLFFALEDALQQLVQAGVLERGGPEGERTFWGYRWNPAREG